MQEVQVAATGCFLPLGYHRQGHTHTCGFENIGILEYLEQIFEWLRVVSATCLSKSFEPKMEHSIAPPLVRQGHTHYLTSPLLGPSPSPAQETPFLSFFSTKATTSFLQPYFVKTSLGKKDELVCDANDEGTPGTMDLQLLRHKYDNNLLGGCIQ